MNVYESPSLSLSGCTCEAYRKRCSRFHLGKMFVCILWCSTFLRFCSRLNFLLCSQFQGGQGQMQLATRDQAPKQKVTPCWKHFAFFVNHWNWRIPTKKKCEGHPDWKKSNKAVEFDLEFRIWTMAIASRESYSSCCYGHVQCCTSSNLPVAFRLHGRWVPVGSNTCVKPNRTSTQRCTTSCTWCICIADMICFALKSLLCRRNSSNLHTFSIKSECHCQVWHQQRLNEETPQSLKAQIDGSAVCIVHPENGMWSSTKCRSLWVKAASSACWTFDAALWISSPTRSETKCVGRFGSWPRSKWAIPTVKWCKNLQTVTRSSCSSQVVSSI